MRTLLLQDRNLREARELSADGQMSNEHHKWKIDSPPPLIRPHSVAKHRVIEQYLSRLDRSEIILTFATDSLIDYLGGRISMPTTLETLGLSLDQDQIQKAKGQADWRRAIQFMLHKEIHAGSGAKYYTPFFIRSKDAHRDYWLIHLSNHSKARDVMVGLHWLENTNFTHFGRPGLVMLGYNQDEDLKMIGERLPLPEFQFDDIARAKTHEALVAELPKRLAGFKDGVTFRALFSGLTNESPATSEIFKATLAVMLGDGVVDIRDETGSIKRVAGVQHQMDVIKPSSQRRLFVP